MTLSESFKDRAKEDIIRELVDRMNDLSDANQEIEELKASRGKEIRRLEALNHILIQRLIEQESFIPKRIKLPDGKIMVWHCPDEWIPVTSLSLEPRDSQTTDNALKSKESSDSPKAGAPPLAKE